ncbi:hypothetical protein [Nocardia thraciensis]
MHKSFKIILGACTVMAATSAIAPSAAAENYWVPVGPFPNPKDCMESLKLDHSNGVVTSPNCNAFEEDSGVYWYYDKIVG